jgi:predicted O-methyltransferase YrrM
VDRPQRELIDVTHALPPRLRSLTPTRLRDDLRLRALAVGSGLIPPRTMHSEEDARVLLEAARGAKRVVEIGVYEGSSALALCQTLAPDAELHLIDPFGAHPDALPSGWGATEWATRRVVSRALRGRGPDAPRVYWHVALSHDVAAGWKGDVDVVFIDGDHSEAGCELDWSSWHGFVGSGGRVVFHDARADQPGGRGLPGPTAVMERHFRSAGAATDPATTTTMPDWKITAEADRTVVVTRAA